MLRCVISQNNLMEMTGFTSLKGKIDLINDKTPWYTLIRAENEFRCTTNRYHIARLGYLKTFSMHDMFIAKYLRRLQDNQLTDGTKFSKYFNKTRVVGLDTSSIDTLIDDFSSGYCIKDIYYFNTYPDFLKPLCLKCGIELITLTSDYVNFVRSNLIQAVDKQLRDILKEHIDLYDGYKILINSCKNSLDGNCDIILFDFNTISFYINIDILYSINCDSLIELFALYEKNQFSDIINFNLSNYRFLRRLNYDN